MFKLPLILQDSARTKNKSQYNNFKESTLQSVQACTLRGQLDLVKGDNPIDISEVSLLSLIQRY